MRLQLINFVGVRRVHGRGLSGDQSASGGPGKASVHAHPRGATCERASIAASVLDHLAGAGVR